MVFDYNNLFAYFHHISNLFMHRLISTFFIQFYQIKGNWFIKRQLDLPFRPNILTEIGTFEFGATLFWERMFTFWMFWKTEFTFEGPERWRNPETSNFKRIRGHRAQFHVISKATSEKWSRKTIKKCTWMISRKSSNDAKIWVISRKKIALRGCAWTVRA